MKYLGQSDYQHATAPRIGVLLTNLGTPEAPTTKALKPYLKQFLWDPRVVEVPRLPRPTVWCGVIAAPPFWPILKTRWRAYRPT